jgi:SAM-dependent methyltransferase
LDIGVGGGRTTIHFGKLCKRYVATDISSKMIEACRQRFAKWPDNLAFLQCDARDLRQFRDAEFDVVLFSFNGIDYIDDEGRLAALREIARVLKPRGRFIFSSHNTRAIPRRVSMKRHVTLHPLNLLRGFKEWIGLNFIHNTPATLRGAIASPHCRINDGVYGFGCETYYIKPEAQVAQLRPLFDVERVYELSRGAEVQSQELATTTSTWLYYFCRKSGQERPTMLS